MRILTALVSLLFSLAVFADVKPQSPVEAAPAQAASTGIYVEGKDYKALDEVVRPADPSKIEVAEVFAYTCPHCFHFEPLIEGWMKKQKSDVVLVQTHTMWNPAMESYQRGYYTVNALHLKEKAHMDVFNAIHVAHKEFPDSKAWADFLSTYGVDKAKVLETYDSFGVSSQVKQADARVRGYKISGTPEMIIDGRFRVTSQLSGGHEEMLKVAQFLVDKIRAERAAKQ